VLSRDQFNALRQQGFNRIALVLETFADLDTPLSIYLKLADAPYTYLLESVVGGLYGGAAGYIGFHGDMDVAITIRTGIINDGRLHVQAAAGIVADSVPEAEWNETRIKAQAVLPAAEVASGGLDTSVE